MRIPRLYLDKSELENGQVVNLDKSNSHYVSNVLRLKPGRLLIIFNNSEYEYTVEITSIDKNSIEITVINKQKSNRESPLNLKLALGVSKNQHMDIALQKAVETGAQEIQPVFTQYSSIKIEKDRLANKLEHWQKLIISACEQSGRTILPKLYEPLLIKDYLSQSISATRVILLPDATKRFTDILCDDKQIDLLIGPEGGFTGEEEEMVEQAGFIAVNLGSRILRTETAVIAAISVCQNIWGDY